MKKEKINFNRGAQFGEKKSAYIFFVFILIIVFIVAFISNQEYVYASLCVLPLFLAFILMADIRGVDVNLEQNKIREYKLLPWGKNGKWKDFELFKKVVLIPSTYDVRTADLNSGGHDVYVDKHKHFVIALTNPLESESIIIGEKSDYKQAQLMAKKASMQLHLELQDKFLERMQNAKRQRYI
ncbi:MAG: hypothetical protein N4A46_08210 [Schleiferiaceae bacterium]|jgi:hypothetical protein|nr:hypothetical protein [Schleiferiaceae bacterium]